MWKFLPRRLAQAIRQMTECRYCHEEATVQMHIEGWRVQTCPSHVDRGLDEYLEVSE